MIKWLAISIAAIGLGCNRNSPSAGAAPVDHPAAAVQQPCKVKLSNLQWDPPAQKSTVSQPSQRVINDRK